MIVDSSVWIEILMQGPLAAKANRSLVASTVAIPTLVIFEVYRKIKARGSEDLALQFAANISRHEVVDLTREIAMLAGDLSLAHDLATADSLVLAHAVHRGVKLLTLDNDFAGLPNVELLRK